MSDIETAYAAGVIDSDGCIGVSRSTWRMRNKGDCVNPTYQARITVKQVEPAAIDLLQSLWPGYRAVQQPSVNKGKPLHAWHIHSQAAGRALTDLLPFLRIKREQAVNALEVCRLSALGSRRFVVPKVIEGEEMLTVAEVAALLGKSYETVYQAVREGSVPHIKGTKNGRKPSVFIPQSYVEIWRTRGHSPSRSPEANARLDACYQRAKELNRVGT